jgi:hypothetical protein
MRAWLTKVDRVQSDNFLITERIEGGEARAKSPIDHATGENLSPWHDARRLP